MTLDGSAAPIDVPLSALNGELPMGGAVLAFSEFSAFRAAVVSADGQVLASSASPVPQS